MSQIKFQNFTFAYPNSKPVLHGIDFELQAGSFTVLCGPSGSGKSTLLRQIKPALAPFGQKSGEVFFVESRITDCDECMLASEIGFVLQNPESQIVTDKVWHELAFGLESLGCDNQTIRRRVAEMASFFGIEDWFYRDTATLSGGQKQLLNLASVMALSPSVLVLDEPTGQLDPIAATEFFATLSRLNRELGITVFVSEQRLEEVLPMADRVLVLDSGRLIADGTPKEVGMKLKEDPFFAAMPTPMRVWRGVDAKTDCPITVREGRAWLSSLTQVRALSEERISKAGESVLSAYGITFGYENDVIKNLSLSLKQGELFALMGGNGTGKTTLLKLLGGILTPARGEITKNGTVALLPQDPKTLFLKKTVREDLECIDPDPDRLSATVSLCRLNDLLDRHPYDLSGGEIQRAALAKVLLTRPQILLLDEPTKGLDPVFKHTLGALLQTLLRRGISILMVSHDTEFCARYAQRCALLFDGSIVTEASPRVFFSGNGFYTTAANRMARSCVPQAVTAEDLIDVLGGTVDPPVIEPEQEYRLPLREELPPLPKWRRRLGILAGAVAAILFVIALRIGNLTNADTTALWLNVGICAALTVLAAAISHRDKTVDLPLLRGKLPLRTKLTVAIVLLLIPLILFFGVKYFGTRRYYLTALLVLFACMVPFFLVFEGRKPQARELVILAVLCALAVAGRAALFMLPQFKPVMAIAIVAGVALGAESGFLVGSISMLASNLLFSQGPWTPWQMFCMGLIGLAAGVLFGKGILRRSRLTLAVYGALSAILIYGGIMNPASALMWSGTLNWQTAISYYITGLPMDCVQAAATALFLWFGGMPMLEKLDRVKEKYGLIKKRV